MKSCFDIPSTKMSILIIFESVVVLFEGAFSRWVSLKETRNSLKKWPLNLWWISNKTSMEVGKITKAATFQSFLDLSYKNTQLPFLWTVLFNIFITLTDDFWGLHKNMNCAFPLNSFSNLDICLNPEYVSVSIEKQIVYRLKRRKKNCASIFNGIITSKYYSKM